jgi:hypothetical protein
MSDARRFLTAEERLQEVQRDRKALRRERLIREVAGPVWHRMVKIVPLSFQAQGQLVARELLASRETVIEALKSDAVFAVDTAMRLAHGVGFWRASRSRPISPETSRWTGSPRRA